MRPYYEERGVRLYRGDNREVLPALLAAGVYRVEEVALLWCDSPYGIGERTDRGKKGRGNNPKLPGQGKKRIHGSLVARDWPAVAGDDEPFDPRPWLAYPRIVFWGANHFADKLPPSPSWWWWDKREYTTPDDNADGELAWTNLGGPARQFHHLWRGLCQASEKAHGGKRLHPTQKPVALARWGFERAKLKPGDLVVSPWLGSGPEAVAARDMGLRFVGVELDLDKDGKTLGYLDACVGRLRQSVLPLAMTESQRGNSSEET